MRKVLKFIKDYWITGCIYLAMFLGYKYIADNQLFGGYLFPAVSKVANSFKENIGTLFMNMFYSFQLMIPAIIIAVVIVLYQVSEKNAQKIYQMAQKENLNCYMSETFEDINDCRTKRDLLKQMERIPKICDVRGVKREKDWYLQGIFSYTLPLIEEAGLSDYSILNLIKEDEKNHTELYDTLKMYLLCENNVTMAAEKLHVHRNTLVYRLKQIKDCLELDINNNEISRELLAFMIMYDLSKSSED